MCWSGSYPTETPLNATHEWNSFSGQGSSTIRFLKSSLLFIYFRMKTKRESIGLLIKLKFVCSRPPLDQIISFSFSHVHTYTFSRPLTIRLHVQLFSQRTSVIQFSGKITTLFQLLLKLFSCISFSCNRFPFIFFFSLFVFAFILHITVYNFFSSQLFAEVSFNARIQFVLKTYCINSIIT